MNIPPNSIETEMVVLGAILIEKDAITSVIDIIKPEVMYKDAHNIILEAIIKLFNQSEPIDLITVSSQLKKMGKLKAVGGPYYLTELTQKVSSAANIEKHARILLEMFVKRETIKIAHEAMLKCYDDTIDGFDNLDFAEQGLMNISSGVVRKNFEKSSSILKIALDEIEKRGKNKNGITGIPSGLTALDKITSGWQKSDLVILAARPGMGKTSLVVSAIRNAAIDFGKPVAMFSLEMSSVQLMNRLISAEAEIDSEKIKKGNLADYEWEQIIHKTSSLANAPIYIDDTPALSILELRGKCRRLKMKHDIQLIIIDYLQLMVGSKKGGNREQEIAEISRSLKTIAKELDVPVIALSQLSRSVETRGGDKRPMLSDLRESGSIEQDADMVLFLYRPEYYGITEDESGNSIKGQAELIIAKHRHGSLENVYLKFIGKYTKFSDLEYSHFDNVGIPEYPNKFPDVPSSFYEKDDTPF